MYIQYTMEFTSQEAERLKPHFSNVDDNIFAITTPNQVDRGALMSRYSRSTKSMRRVFLDEFLNNPDRGKEFYNRVLIEYGDDSVAELGTAQMAIEGLSNVAAQSIEDRRVGLSFLEKSSRYVSWTAKDGGHYRYYRGSDIMESRHEKAYQDACDLSFDTYAENMNPVLECIVETHPIDDFPFLDSRDNVEKPFSMLGLDADIRAAERAYKNAAKSMTLDMLRGLLPASTLTNLGITGNGRAFEYLVSILKSSQIYETQTLGERLATELSSTMGPFVRRASGIYGRQLEEYLSKLENISGRIKFPISSDTPSDVRLVLCDSQNEAMDAVVSGLLYGSGVYAFEDVHKAVGAMPTQWKHDIIQSFADARQNRRQRPPRAFEMSSYTFDMTNNYGMFRDMHRHRILTLQRQLLTTQHGYDIPPELEAMSLAEPFKECMKRSAQVYDIMARDDPQMAQYVVNFAYRYRYMIRINLRELCHLVELRTLPQGHRDYRNVAYNMYDMVCKKHPDLSRIIKFADKNAYFMGRIDSEKRVAKKIMANLTTDTDENINAPKNI